MWRNRVFLGLCGLLLLTISVGEARLETKKDAPHDQMLPSREILSTGDLIFRRMHGLASQYVDLLDREGEFSHVGMISVPPNSDQVFVIHVQPENPSTVQQETIQDFLQGARTFAIYRLTEAGAFADLAVSRAMEWLGERDFDLKFDLETDHTLYCTELVWKAYLYAGIDITGGELNHVNFPFLETKVVILPSSFFESGLVSQVYP